MSIDPDTVQAQINEQLATALREEQIRFHQAQGATREVAERMTDRLTRRGKVLK